MDIDYDYLKAASDAVARQLTENPNLGLQVDPEVAEHMGAFPETALTENDLLDDYLLNGEGVYVD